MTGDLRREMIFDFLDELRESGIVNMYGAGPYIQSAFGVTREEAHQYLAQWMDGFPRNPENEEGGR